MKKRAVGMGVMVSGVAIVGLVACREEPRPEERGRAATRTTQALTIDDECMRMAGSVTAVYAGIHRGDHSGTADLGDGETATITTSDGVEFDWSATIPIDIIWVRGSPTWANVFFQKPPATSGTDLRPPRDPDDGDRQLPLTEVKFCFRDRKGPAEPFTAPSSETQSCLPFRENTGYTTSGAILGRVDSTDPVKYGRFGTTGPATTCSAWGSPPSVEESTTAFHYEAWKFRNWTDAEACVSVSALTATPGGQPFQVQVFHDSFEERNLGRNYWAHADGCHDGCDLSVRVPANATFYVVLSGAAEGGAEAAFGMNYRLAVGGCGTRAGAGDGGTGGPIDAGPAEDGGGKTW